MTVSLTCWKCGVALESFTPPFSRTDACHACRAELHVCRMCRFYDTSKAKFCAEPIADEVQDKTRANFCGYFIAAGGRHIPLDDAGNRAKAALESLFGAKK
ncbi:MAG: hypothetical protein WD929_04845 [Steroidobacteraceae bacterium]